MDSPEGTTEPNGPTPSIIQESIEQAKSESREELSQDSAEVIGRVIPNGIVEIGGMVAHKLGWARKTIIMRAMGIKNDDQEAAESVLVADNMDTLTISIYILFEPDVAKLYRLSKQGDALAEMAIVFSEKIEEDAYEEMIMYATHKLNDLNSSSEVGASGPDGQPQEVEGPEKNFGS
jgi:hypothetical protein